MKARVLTSLLLSALAAGQSARPEANRTAQFSPAHNKVHFLYNFKVKDIPPGSKRVRVWVPVVHSDEHQTVHLLNTNAPTKTRMTRDREYGNWILFAEIPNPQGEAEFTLEYEITRREYSRGDYAQLELRDSLPGLVPASMARFVAPDKLIPTDGRIKALAREVTGKETGTVAKAKAAYNYLFSTMRYDKSGTGWGRGDAIWACDTKRGNCTDFHSPFIGIMRAEQIPARFDIGFPLPEDKSEGDIAGCHCWAEFYSPKIGWIPVDISEAWKAKVRRDYFFGSIDANRVMLSTGRDIILTPKQDGPPLNYFVYPYVEVDGKPYDNIAKHFSFKQLGSSHKKTTTSQPLIPRSSSSSP
jgi:transglutaminase-like putative cysteine protease